MEWRGRWIQVPDVPLPTENIDAHPKVGIFVNREWKEALLSLVSHADQAKTWESDDIDHVEQSAFKLFEIIYRATGMIGAVIPYAGETNPPGTLPCDGSEYPREDYPMLWEILGERYQIQKLFPKPGHYLVTPDFRGMFVLAAQPGQHEAFSTGGAAEHTLTEAEMPEHTHTAEPHSHTNAPHAHSYNVPLVGIDFEQPIAVPDPSAVGNPPMPQVTGLESVSIDNATVTIQTTGGGQAHNNMPPFIALNYAIVCY